jgi:protocatechuate 3,4-dioxygenase beta subunit
MRRVHIVAAALAGGLLAGGCAQAQGPEAPAGSEPILDLPCEGCEAVFDGLPGTLASRVRIAPPDEPGEPLRIEGRVLDPAGRPAPGVIVYAYHTNARGIYPRGEPPLGLHARRHGRLRGWAASDAEGRYRFDTIRPASYPDTRIPAHVHLHVIEPGCCTYVIDDIHFADDPLLSGTERQRLAAGRRGGAGLATPRRDGEVWVVTRDIVLGKGVPGHPRHAGGP